MQTVLRYWLSKMFLLVYIPSTYPNNINVQSLDRSLHHSIHDYSVALLCQLLELLLFSLLVVNSAFTSSKGVSTAKFHDCQ
ncbi:hypothetical protein ANAPRD1_00005 [Anaplasma phagocytophilum]|nr:hypothetical protein ANAPRD1_00005 [Anaplasma phagocytophilum]SCV65788.1 hypothetical protein ANAPH2_01377 [Anaplasma phagocytophilum]